MAVAERMAESKCETIGADGFVFVIDQHVDEEGVDGPAQCRQGGIAVPNSSRATDWAASPRP